VTIPGKAFNSPGGHGKKRGVPHFAKGAGPRVRPLLPSLTRAGFRLLQASLNCFKASVVVGFSPDFAYDLDMLDRVFSVDDENGPRQ